MKTYMLVNPVIQGNINTEVKAENSLEAAHQLYAAMSRYFANSVNDFKFTIAKVPGSGAFDLAKLENKNFSHFQVSEKKTMNGGGEGEKKVEYALKPYTGKLLDLNAMKKAISKSLRKLQEGGADSDSTVQQHGGKHHHKKKRYDSSSSSSSDSSDDYKYTKRYYSEPIWMWNYYPVYADGTVYIPTFPFDLDYTLEIYPFWPYAVIGDKKGSKTVDNITA